MFSLIIPVFNEELLLKTLIDRVVKSVESFTCDYEIIFVDDGSTDTSLQIILQSRNSNRRIKCLQLSNNFGHQAAYTAGLEHASGDIVAMMDGDLQDPPELLREMYRKITDENVDIVSGKKTARKGSKTRNFTTRLFHGLFKSISGIKGMENYGNFSMMKRQAVDALLSMKEKIRYLPGLRTFIGFNSCEIEFVRDDRWAGKPKMTFKKLVSLAMDAIFSFSRFPVGLCVAVGMAGAAVFGIAGICALISVFTKSVIMLRPLFLAGSCLFAAFVLLFMCVIGEYIFRCYKELQDRPLYFIKEKFGDL